MKNFQRIKIISIIFFFLFGGIILGLVLKNNLSSATAKDLSLDDQEATVRAIKKVMPSVVSIMSYSDKALISSGTGFLISSDGLILTNKHVLGGDSEEIGEYRIVLNSGKKYYAQLIGKDPAKDLAVLKIFDKNLPHVELGDSNKLDLGITVMAIGNSLGRYQNSVTKGIVSGLGRSLVASDQNGNVETLDNVIQTDAEINLGNSGGPLIDLNGKVVGINVAVDESGSAIGFAIPVDDAKPVIKSVREVGRIIRPILGVHYLMITPDVVIENNLLRDNGAWLNDTDTIPAVVPGFPADKAGLEKGDIIFEVNAIKIEGQNNLFSVIQKYKPGNKIGLKIQRGDKIMVKEVVLEEFK